MLDRSFRLFVKLCHLPSKNNLEKKIIKRFNEMLKMGALEEVRKYKKKFLEPATYISANSIIGINEIKKHLDKKLNKDQTIELMVIKTRQYAKRQATWARGQMKNWKTLNPQDVKFSLKKLFN